MADHLLPTNATPLERALSRTTLRVDDLDAPIVKFAKTCPVEFLPFLAWEFSVDIWNDDWPVERQRWVILESLALHRIKGTLEGIRRHLALADADLFSVIRPPAKFFAGKTMTQDERAVWLARYPQLRLYSYRDRGTRHAKGFYAGSASIKCFLRDEQEPPNKVAFSRTSDAAARVGRNAYYFEPDDGSETRMSWIERRYGVDQREAVEFERVGKRGARSRGFFAGASFAGDAFATVDGAASERIYTFAITRFYNAPDETRTLRTFSPALEPVEVRPEHVAETGTAAPRALYASRPLRRLHTTPSTAHERLYDRIYLHDPARPVPLRGAWGFAGHVRLGIPDFTAELEVAIRGRRVKRGLYAGKYVGGFALPVDMHLIERVCRAVRAGKSVRDKTLIDTTTMRSLQFRDLDRLPVGARFNTTVRG